jgi:hypothetical protein
VAMVVELGSRLSVSSLSVLAGGGVGGVEVSGGGDGGCSSSILVVCSSCTHRLLKNH